MACCSHCFATFELVIVFRALTNYGFAVLNSHLCSWDSYFLKGTIFFCMVVLPLIGREGSETPVFKVLVRALLYGHGFSMMSLSCGCHVILKSYVLRMRFDS